MFLKRRNVIAWVLLFAAALAWTFGQQFWNLTEDGVLGTTAQDMTMANTQVTISPSTYPVENQTEPGTTGSILPSEPGNRETTRPTTSGQDSRSSAAGKDSRGRKALGLFLCLSGIAMAIVAVFLLRQETPILGPDGVALLPPVLAMLSYFLLIIPNGNQENMSVGILITFLVLMSAREIWGWIRAKHPLSWCLIHRLAGRCPMPQLSLMVYVGWIVAILGEIAFLSFQRIWYIPYTTPLICAILSGILGVCCLWKYGADLHHFEKQLDNFRNGLPIAVKDGAFAQTEAQLLEVQAQHEEAVRTAVTSERFKVELISNVSHDLRTPLTAILGYGELLQKQALSPEGREQLLRLNQKAGYMRDLVESLFELTKVSSGVIEAKKEKIDLIRLLEQTIGLFDDQLTAAGLRVRRHYAADSLPVVTDGARMHQVFANLLGNAIKYALPGTRIHVEVKDGDAGCTVRMINTASYEMDFNPEEIIQRFARGDKARSTKGSGLGLAIAQTYTESVGGAFTVAVDGDQFSAIVKLPKN